VYRTKYRIVPVTNLNIYFRLALPAVLNRAQNSRCTVIIDLEHTGSLFLLRRHLGNWPRDPAVSMKSELLVAHEKLRQLPLLTVHVVPV
jgi:hypothetical protein